MNVVVNVAVEGERWMLAVARLGVPRLRRKLDAAIVRSVINVGQTLKIGVVAEGVETTAQRDFLLRNGCIEAQGYLYGRPMPADRLTDFLRNQPR